MEKRIEQQRHGKQAAEVTRLKLDDCRATEIVGLTDEYTNLSSLSLINVGLASLKGLPNLPKLRRLDLSDNRISGDLNLLKGCPSLVYLNLSGNPIKTVEVLEPLKSLRGLHNIDLFNCELANTDGYREKIFELLAGLLYIDGFDKNDQEADIDDDDDDDDESEGEEGPNGDHVVDLDDDDDEEDDEVGLEYLQKSGLENESDGEEFAPREGQNEDADDDDDDDSDEEAEPAKTKTGVKRKHDETEDKQDAE